MTIQLSHTIEQRLLAIRKATTVYTYKRQLKCLGISEITEQSLKGNIKSLVDKFMTKNYSTPKVYINALLNVYQVCEFDEEELKYLKSQFDNICKSSDEMRQIKKEQQQSDLFTFTWDDLQRLYKHWEEIYNSNPTPYNLTNWFIISLLSDEQYGIKRTIDLINLSKANIKNNTICFTAQKNNFKYESLQLSAHIMRPLTLLMIQNKKQTLILTSSGMRYTTNNFLHRLKEVLQSNVNSQYLRRLWASYQYSKHPTPKELIRQAYELNHDISTHLSDYVSEYNTADYKVLKVYKFKKQTTWVKA
jgi:hypothetical protein